MFRHRAARRWRVRVRPNGAVCREGMVLFREDGRPEPFAVMEPAAARPTSSERDSSSWMGPGSVDTAEALEAVGYRSLETAGADEAARTSSRRNVTRVEGASGEPEAGRVHAGPVDIALANGTRPPASGRKPWAAGRRRWTRKSGGTQVRFVEPANRAARGGSGRPRACSSGSPRGDEVTRGTLKWKRREKHRSWKPSPPKRLHGVYRESPLARGSAAEWAET